MRENGRPCSSALRVVIAVASEPIARAKLKEVVRPGHAPFALGLLILTPDRLKAGLRTPPSRVPYRSEFRL